MTGNKLLGVDEVAETKLNNELQESGHYVVPGKVNKAFLIEKFFGIPERQTGEE